MQLRFTHLILTAVTAIALVAASKPNPAQVMLEAARKSAIVDGDLKAAIKQYADIVVKYGKSDRAVTATALVRMAECHLKLGDAEAQKIYERVVRDYADQNEAVAMARARLVGANSVTSAKGDRAVWTGPLVDMFGRVSLDGRLITFVDWNTGRLMAHDVIANVDRELTPAYPNSSQSASYSTISRDGKRVAYAWFNERGRQDLRVATFQGNGLSEPKQFFPGGDDIAFLHPADWSPDGKWIALGIQRKDGTGQIALVSVADGSLRVLKSVGWNGPDRMFFSLDGKYIAYDRPASDTSDQRDVFVMAIDGSREIPAVVHPSQETVMGWSPDGTQLLFSSDRTGSVGLWALPFADGTSNGKPELLRSDIGSSIESLGLTASGALYLYKGISSRDIKIAPIDLNTGKLTGPPASFTQGFLPGAKVPNWSPDGKYFAYAACGSKCVAVRSVETGEVRRLPQTLYVRAPRWSPDGRSFLTAGRDQKGRDGIFLIDAQTGEVSSVVYGGGLRGPEWSGDGKSIYYYNRTGPALLERNLVSGVEKEIIRIPRLRQEVGLSPDGRYFAVQTNEDSSTKTSSLLLVPVQGGQSRELLRLTQPDEWGALQNMAWTPDSRGVVVTKLTTSGAELLLVPIDGAPPRKLDIDAESWMRGAQGGTDQGFTLSPDGSHVAFLMGKSGSEVWALENLLPRPTSKR